LSRKEKKKKLLNTHHQTLKANREQTAKH